MSLWRPRDHPSWPPLSNTKTAIFDHGRYRRRAPRPPSCTLTAVLTPAELSKPLAPATPLASSTPRLFGIVEILEGHLLFSFCCSRPAISSGIPSDITGTRAPSESSTSRWDLNFTWEPAEPLQLATVAVLIDSAREKAKCARWLRVTIFY